MTLYFITGNKNKLREFQEQIPVEQLDIDLDEIQSLDPKEVIKHKLEQARKHHEGDFIVEDTSLAIESLNGLPGTLIKFFLEKLGSEGIAKLSEGSKVEAITLIGLMKDGKINYFEGKVKGTIVMPRGENGFGYDNIFMAEGFEETYAEMKNKNEVSPRAKAINKLKEFLQ